MEFLELELFWNILFGLEVINYYINKRTFVCFIAVMTLSYYFLRNHK